MTYYIRNDNTGHAWSTKSRAEARLYAEMLVDYSVFRAGGSGTALHPLEL